MGQTPKALRMTIAVHPSFVEHDAIKELAEKGHTIVPLDGPDLILSPVAHRWTEEMWKYKGILGKVLAEIRVIRRAAKKGAKAT